MLANLNTLIKMYSMIARFLTNFISMTKGVTREVDKGAEAPPLDKLKLRNKIKYRTALIFFCVSVI